MSFDISQISYDDPKTWDLFAKGETLGVFQCESRLVRGWLKKIKPTNIWELSAVIALVRPGALESGMADTYVNNRENPENQIVFGHPIVDDIFKSTEGILCIEENTRVALANGSYKKIKDIRRLDRLQSFDPNTKKMVIKECHGCAKTSEGVGYKITLYNGRSIILTANHEVYTYDGKKRVDQLDINLDCIASPNKYLKEESISAIPGNIFDDDGTKIAYLIGIMLADGNFGTSISSLCCGNLENTADKLENWIKNNLINITCRKYFDGRTWNLSITSDIKAPKNLGYGNAKKYFKYFLDILKINNKICYNKFVPTEILESNLEVQKAFLAGFTDGDGCVAVSPNGDQNIFLTTVSEELLYGLSHILTNLELQHTVVKNRIKIYDHLKMMDILSEYSVIKNNCVQGNQLTGQTLGVVPYKAIEDKRNELNLGRRAFNKLFNTDSRNYNNFVTYDKYTRLGLDTGDIRYHAIKSIEKIENCTFYDISVADTHLLIGNGVIISNCYQESLMHLGSRLAWPDLPSLELAVKVDKLRKAVGKKSQEAILKMGKEFVEGCIRNEVPHEVADRLFEIIKNCGRYLFNLSHSITYAVLAYRTAYLKANYPKEFFATYLTYSQYKQGKQADQYLEFLINDARFFEIGILPPNINSKNMDFQIEGDNIRYGLSHLKFFGNTAGEVIERLPQITCWQQVVLLALTDTFGHKLNSRTTESLIASGTMDSMKFGRKNLLSVVHIFGKLTDRELKWCLERFADFTTKNDIKKLLTLCSNEVSNAKRRVILQSEIQALDLEQYDHPAWIEEQERKYLKCPITATAVDAKTNQVIDTCLQCKGDFAKYSKKTIQACLSKIHFTTTKKGQNPGQKMARLEVYDSSGILDNLPVFPDTYVEYQDYLIPNNIVILNLYMGNSGWVVESITK